MNNQFHRYRGFSLANFKGSRGGEYHVDSARTGLGCNSHSDPKREVSRLETSARTGWNNQAIMTDESREAEERRKGERGKKEAKQPELLPAGLQSLVGLHKVDDGDTLCWDMLSHAYVLQTKFCWKRIVRPVPPKKIEDTAKWKKQNRICLFSKL